MVNLGVGRPPPTGIPQLGPGNGVPAASRGSSRHRSTWRSPGCTMDPAVGPGFTTGPWSKNLRSQISYVANVLKMVKSGSALRDFRVHYQSAVLQTHTPLHWKSLREFLICEIEDWLVVEPPPLKNDGVRQLGWWNSRYDGKVIKNHVPNINWWFQPPWKILVRLDHHPNYWGSHNSHVPNHQQVVI